MPSWQLQDAKARFSERLERLLAEGPQTLSERGAEATVSIAADESRRPLTPETRPTLKDLLLTDAARTDALVPERRRARRRAP